MGMHDFKNRLQAQKKANPDTFTRFECITILDLDGLSVSAITQMALRIVKEQSHIDSLCFPETLTRMVIVNAPRVFSATWNMIKGWLDPRTISKIDLISNRSAWEKRLKELIDEDQLPVDYGGKAEDTKTTMIKEAISEFKRLFTKVLSSGALILHLSSLKLAKLWKSSFSPVPNLEVHSMLKTRKIRKRKNLFASSSLNILVEIV